MPEGLEMVQIGRSKAQMNAIDEGNPTQVSAWQSLLEMFGAAHHTKPPGKALNP